MDFDDFFKIFIVFIIIGAIIGLMVGCPSYNVYYSKKQGEAELAKAEQSKQIILAEATARLEAARLEAEAEVIRARGMAEAIEIEGGLLTPEYNQYLMIRTLNEMSERGHPPELIYLPTNNIFPTIDIKKQKSTE